MSWIFWGVFGPCTRSPEPQASGGGSTPPRAQGRYLRTWHAQNPRTRAAHVTALTHRPTTPEHYTELYCTAPQCTVLHCTAVYCTALHCSVPYCTAWQCSALHSSVSCWTSLYCTVQHCMAVLLHSTALQLQLPCSVVDSIQSLEYFFLHVVFPFYWGFSPRLLAS